MNAFNMILSHLGLSRSTMEKSSFEIALKEKKLIAEGTYEFTFEKPQNFQFNAGQHVRMTLINPLETDSKGNSRFMTLANTPQESELTIAMRMSGSAFKNALGKLPVGDKVLIQILQHSPHGSFVIHEDSSKPAVFLTGGIGIVPAYSMIKDAIERKLPHMIFLFYSNRRIEDAAYLEQLQRLAKQHPNFKLIATMTETGKSSKEWEGEKGYINQTMLKRYIHDLHTPVYYIAGLTNMVGAMKRLLKDIGIKENNIRSEDFSGMKMNVINMTNNPKSSKNHLVFALIGLIVIILILAHAGIAVSTFKALSLQNLSYITLGSIFVIIVLKVFLILKIKHRLNLKQKEE
jgi:ferredoxin-NADP reductase